MSARIGVAFQTDKASGRYARLAALAERGGVDVISVYADLGFQPPLPALLEIARSTERVSLGPACLNPYTMHPYEIAGFVASIDHASAGRAYLGLARGAWLGSIGVDQADPPGHIREAWEVVSRLLAGRDDGFSGRHFTLRAGARLEYPVTRNRVPLLVGGWGPRMLEMAGAVADEVKIGGSANPAMVDVARRRLAIGEMGAGRPPGSVGLVMGSVTVVDEDGVAARRHARRQVAMYVDVVADLDPTFVIDPENLERIRSALEVGDHHTAGSMVSDDALDRFAFSGTPEAVAARAAALFEAGATRVEFGTPHGLDPEVGLEMIGKRIVPALESAL